MAAYTVSAGHRGAYRMSGAASTEDTVTFSRDLSPEPVGVQVESGGPVYFTVNGSAATVPAAGASSACYQALAGETVAVEVRSGGTTAVRLNFAAPAVYSVMVES